MTDVHLWDGVRDPYLYTAEATLVVDGKEVDQVTARFGVRTSSIDPKEGFFLNGSSYPLRGVSRHQDWKGLGNALTREQHDTDMKLIRDMDANTIRLAHYQHDQYFYDLCGKRYIDRPEAETEVKVCSNQPKAALYADGKPIGEKTGERVFRFRVPLEGEVKLEARAGDCSDSAAIHRVSAPNPAYELNGPSSNSANWV